MTEETAEHGVPLYMVTDWADRFPWLFAAITHAGSGSDPFDLRLFGGPASERAPARWNDLLQASEFETIVYARQVHETRIVIHDRVGKGVRETEGGADGHTTADSGVLLAVTVADCVPVYLVDADAPAVALLHAGWRGTAAGILLRGITLFGQRWGSDPGRRRLNRLRGRGKAAAGAVGSDGIVLAPPLLDQHGRLRQRAEDLPVQQLVPELAVEALVVAVLPRAARAPGTLSSPTPRAADG